LDSKSLSLKRNEKFKKELDTPHPSKELVFHKRRRIKQKPVPTCYSMLFSLRVLYLTLSNILFKLVLNLTPKQHH
jgi:hypothetical protein